MITYIIKVTGIFLHVTTIKAAVCMKLFYIFFVKLYFHPLILNYSDILKVLVINHDLESLTSLIEVCPTTDKYIQLHFEPTFAAIQVCSQKMLLISIVKISLIKTGNSLAISAILQLTTCYYNAKQ